VLITLRPIGGHIEPNNIDGQMAEWNKAQKNPKNNINSETKNNKNPRFNPRFTIKVCWPKYVDSVIISLNQE
jgi:hypothetical protein